MKQILTLLACSLMLLQSAWGQPFSGERLDRGFVGRPVEKGFYLSWRMLPADAADLAFDLYRSTDGGPAVKLNDAPILRTSDFVDTGADLARDNRWSLRSRRRWLPSRFRSCWHRPRRR